MSKTVMLLLLLDLYIRYHKLLYGTLVLYIGVTAHVCIMLSVVLLSEFSVIMFFPYLQHVKDQLPLTRGKANGVDAKAEAA